MSLLVRVELPTYSHSFQVSVPSTGTINDVKREIENVCVGNPRVQGQRLIWRGRFLGDDEKVLDTWKSPNDVPVVHLSVHPSAWASTPPSITTTTSVNPSPPATTTTPPAHASHNTGGDPPAPTAPLPPAQHSGPSPRTAQPGTGSTSAALPAPTSVPGLAPVSVGYLNYIAHQHLSAASVLRYGRLPEDSRPSGLAESKNLAKQLVTQWGYQWPPVFDEEYPPMQDQSAGIKYEQVTIDGQEYLRLVDPSKTPTPLQVHALRVLEHTFALFSMPLPSAPTFPIPPPPQTNTHPPVHINAHLQQIGLPPLRVRQENAVIAELRAVPMRALAGPLLMLTLRTLFLLYFFSPFQKPVFGIIVTAWLLYETWNTIRNAMPRLHARVPHIDDAPMRPPEAAVARAAPGPPHRTPMQRHRPASETLIGTLANVNLREETGALDSRPDAMTAPTLGYRIKTFIQLLVLTAHPAIWDRRRAALRQREGRVRTEMNALERSAPDGDGRTDEVRARVRAEHERRAGWVAEYMERVRGGGDWMEDQ